MRTLVMISIAVLLGVGAASGAPKAAPFVWGVNGHPYVQVGYCDVPVTTQLDLVKDLGVTWYRSDWSEKGARANPANYDKLVDEAAKRGIHILPIIFPDVSARSDASPDEIRAASYKFAYWIGRHFRGRITHWELDNELDAFAMIRKGETDRKGTVWQWGDANGDVPEQFEDTRYGKVKAEMLGLHAGIKAADAKMKTMIDSCGWLHYGYLDRLVREDKVPFDILAWHWYSEMGDMTKVNGSFNVWERIRSYGKPIWVTEIDRRGGSTDGEHQQADYITQTAKQVRRLPGAAAFFVYELQDEPYFGPENPESHYGLVRIQKGEDGKWQIAGRKEAFGAYRSVVKP